MVGAVRPAERTSLVQAVADKLRQLVVRGDLRPGDRLPSETELMKQLRVSRPVLREAISRLAAVGLLSVRHGSGTFVAGREWLSNCTKLAGSAMTIQPRELLQFVELRRALESHAARKAATVASPEQVAALERTLEEAVCIATQGSKRAMEADFRFHCMLVEIGGNPLMRALLELLHEFILAGMVRTLPPALVDPQSAAVHRAIVKAIANRRPEAAAQAVLAHMDLLAARLDAASAGRKTSGGTNAARKKKTMGRGFPRGGIR